MSESHLIGVDIGGTNIRAALVGDDGALGARVKFPTRASRGPDAVIGDIVEHLRGLIEGADSPVCGIGVGCPGPLSTATGVVHEAPNLPGWVNLPLRDRLQSALEVPVAVHNDANAAAWGEFWLGAGREVDTAVMFTLGTGVGGGLVIGGRLHIGADTTAGELGHMCVVPGGRRCGCGADGCLEAYASATAVAARAREALAEGQASALAQIDAENLTAHDVDHAADAGDALSIEILRETGRHLGQVAADLVHALNPERIIFGGGMTDAKQWLFPEIERVIAERCFDAPVARVKVVEAALGDDAGILGAAGLAMAGEVSA